MSTIQRTDQEVAALAIWRKLTGREPTDPLREKGGALDPDAWCMEAAAAALHGREIPRIATDKQAPAWVPDVVARRG